MRAIAWLLVSRFGLFSREDLRPMLAAYKAERDEAFRQRDQARAECCQARLLHQAQLAAIRDEIRRVLDGDQGEEAE